MTKAASLASRAEPYPCLVAAWLESGAFADLADTYDRHSVDGSQQPSVALRVPTDYAPLAAVRGGSRQDWINLLFLLDQQAEALRGNGESDQADNVQAEAVALAEYMADNGDEEVGRMLVASAEQLPRGVLQLAIERPHQPDLLSLSSLMSPDLPADD